MQSPATETPQQHKWYGDELKSTLLFLALPGIFGVIILFFGVKLPSWALYGVAGLIGLRLVMHTFKSPEWLLASFVLYIPLNKMFVIPIAPGINGTNMFLMLLIWAWIMGQQSSATTIKAPKPTAFRGLVIWYGVWTFISVFTAGMHFGLGNIVSSHAMDIKAWCDQFIIFFAVINLIRDANMAKRLVVYMLIGTLLVITLGIQEWLDKRFLASIEKARLLGPQMQPNDFGAFLGYTGMMLIAWFIVAIRQIKTWIILPPILFMLMKLLLATFSRGAYLAVGFAGVVAGYVRGKLFLFTMTALCIGMLIAMPELIPESLVQRMSQTTSDQGATEELDESSQTRLILWKAAIEMSIENPLFGKGFKSFPKLKGQYTEEDVHEADNHNMYLYLASQMGIPAVLLFLALLAKMYFTGIKVFRHQTEPFARIVGLSAVGMAASIGVINMFGSRMVDVAVTCYFWIMMAVLAHMDANTIVPKKDKVY